jgi:hypothetical protein
MNLFIERITRETGAKCPESSTGFFDNGDALNSTGSESFGQIAIIAAGWYCSIFWGGNQQLVISIFLG